MKTLVIGDIHGCYAEMDELLAKAGLSSGDAIIAIGDIVDRGPETPQVLDFFMQQPGARSLMGNHERKHVRASRHEVKLSLSQIIARAQLAETYPAALTWMAALPTWIELPEAFLVHGYLEPDLYIEEQLDSVLCGTMGGEKHLQSWYKHPWYELYDGDKPVVVGHSDYRKDGQAFVYRQRVFGLDTSCVHGKRLTGLLLPNFNIISVPSRGDHWSATRREYRLQHPKLPALRKPRPSGSTTWDEQSETILAALLARVAAQNEQVLSRLRQDPDFENLTPRQQARAYAAEIGDTPLATLLHLARRGELDVVKARQVIKSPDWAVELAKL
jgi:serine/threonine protein phosphatase 1